MYNEVIDKEKYQDASAILKSKCQKELEEFKAWNDQKKYKEEKTRNEEAKEASNKKLGILMLFGGLIVLLIGILTCCAVPFSGFGILCIVGGALIAAFSLVPFLQ